MFSEANRQRLSQALGRYILAVPMRKVTEVSTRRTPRPGRYRLILRVRRSSARASGGAYVVCHNPDEAAREQARRARLWSWSRRNSRRSTSDRPITQEGLRADGLTPLRTLPADGCPRPPRYRYHEGGGGREYDGKFVVTTNDGTLDAADVALGYTSMTLIEGCFRR